MNNIPIVFGAWKGVSCGRSAAGEFQKLIENPGLCLGYITGPLARLQLGRAQHLMGDNASARESYEEFLTIREDADANLPVYRQANET